MTSLAYNNKQFNQKSPACGPQVSFVSNRQLTQTDSPIGMVDWDARTSELLSLFSDDSLPSVSGKFGTFLY